MQNHQAQRLIFQIPKVIKLSKYKITQIHLDLSWTGIVQCLYWE